MNENDRARIAFKTLNRIYPNIKVPLNSRNVFTLLISVLLSAQCTDVNVNNVTKNVCKILYTLGNFFCRLAVLFWFRSKNSIRN